MDENEEIEESEFESYPELEPECGPNFYDYCRVLILPVRGYFQGFSAMLEQFEGLFSMHSRVHDAKKSAQAMERALK